MKRPARLFVAFVTEAGRSSGLFHDDHSRGRPLCVETTERMCRAEVRGCWGVVPRDSYEVVTYTMSGVVVINRHRWRSSP